MLMFPQRGRRVREPPPLVRLTAHPNIHAYEAVSLVRYGTSSPHPRFSPSAPNFVTSLRRRSGPNSN